MTQLESGRHYRIRYAARNIVWDADNIFECDRLQFSEPISVWTAVTPSKPLHLAHDMSLRCRDALVFKWERPAKDGSSELKVYTLVITNVATGDS